MRNLTFIFLLIGFFCMAKGQSDSATLVKLAEQLEQKNNNLKQLINKAETVEKKHESAFTRLKIYIRNLVSDKAEKGSRPQYSSNKEGVREKNTLEPVTEIPDGYDSIRGGWIYRLLHKSDFLIKPYKLNGNEKIYLD